MSDNKIIQVIKDNLDSFEDAEQFKSFVYGLIEGYQVGGLDKEIQSSYTIEDAPQSVVDGLLETLDSIPSTVDVFLWYDSATDQYELRNSDQMTDEDRKKLPLNVWIKHDGKSVPVLDNGSYIVKTPENYTGNDTYSQRFTFKDEFLWQYDNVSEFKIIKIGTSPSCN